MINNKSYINGEWVSGLGKSFVNINPSDTKDIISEYNECNVEQFNQAVEAAKKAQLEWASVGIEKKSNILILGLTFKEDVPDTRNSKVFDLIKYFEKARHSVDVCDYLVDPEQLSTINLKEYKELSDHKYDVLIITVLHSVYKKLKIKDFKKLLKKDGLIADLKGFWRKKIENDNYWSL